ncbi:hypothetical protein DFH06DRAFT_1136920 [Mycena polygramma]|nr:hypothetical protein DFH06DRAFT_1136920 [Mycena polygramma]
MSQRMYIERVSLALSTSSNLGQILQHRVCQPETPRSLWIETLCPERPIIRGKWIVGFSTGWKSDGMEGASKERVNAINQCIMIDVPLGYGGTLEEEQPRITPHSPTIPFHSTTISSTRAARTTPALDLPRPALSALSRAPPQPASAPRGSAPPPARLYYPLIAEQGGDLRLEATLQPVGDKLVSCAESGVYAFEIRHDFYLDTGRMRQTYVRTVHGHEGPGQRWGWEWEEWAQSERRIAGLFRLQPWDALPAGFAVIPLVVRAQAQEEDVAK